MYWTEYEIKQRLDGTFTRFDAVTGQPVTVFVAADHQPNHSHIGRSFGEEYEHAKFTADEDIILKELRRRHMPISEIAERMGRTEASIKAHLRLLAGRK